MDISTFDDKKHLPNNNDLIESLGKTYSLWNKIVEYVHLKYPGAIDEWNYPGVKYGWSFRIKDKKRAIIYLLPRDKYFKVAFVFGMNVTTKIMASQVADSIKNELEAAKVYAEGRGIRIEVKKEANLKDIFLLIDFKIEN